MTADLDSTKKHPGFWTVVRQPDILKQSSKVGSVVGTMVVAINHGDIILAGLIPAVWKLVLCYCVPFGVSSYSSAKFRLAAARGK
ncbi:nitrate/nitrite transporter NrtS [Govanella unica]|uniref:Nitrate/nitrite transporter NrtS n=1 Tax=Govanella unica TaxID=2975056 RepID=A0A9X3TYW9_9PROT|nr:nitrate/nitrite transporter NrtS [Govania unica]MDA5193957.1 nitrate/nitrite transporter NrtS [Govania unica]